MDELRHVLANCHLCAFIDLDVELVLSFSALQKPHQEHLDTLARLAVSLLNISPVLRSSGGDQNTNGAPEIITFLTKDISYILLRSSITPSEVIFCQCGASVDPEAVEAGAQLTLQWIKDAA